MIECLIEAVLQHIAWDVLNYKTVTVMYICQLTKQHK
jgi:hypothetical protein